MVHLLYIANRFDVSRNAISIDGGDGVRGWAVIALLRPDAEGLDVTELLAHRSDIYCFGFYCFGGLCTGT